MPEGRVLVVEDQEDLREVMADTLHEFGYEVLEAGNGKEALEVLRRVAPPDVVLLDLMMPVMDGRELLAVLGRDPALRAIPVVIATAFVLDVPPGVRGVLKKPFTLAELTSCLHELIPRRSPAAL